MKMIKKLVVLLLAATMLVGCGKTTKPQETTTPTTELETSDASTYFKLSDNIVKLADVAINESEKMLSDKGYTKTAHDKINNAITQYNSSVSTTADDDVLMYCKDIVLEMELYIEDLTDTTMIKDWIDNLKKKIQYNKEN